MGVKRYKCGKCGFVCNREAKLKDHDCKNKTNTENKSEINTRSNQSGILPLVQIGPTIYITREESQRRYKRIEELASQYDWVRIAPDGVLEIFADHHMLSTFRTCEAKFEEEIVNNIIPKERSWSLSFGIAFHKYMEWFDEAEDKNFSGTWNDNYTIPDDVTGWKGSGNRITLATWVYRCKEYWLENKLDEFKDADGFKELDGWPGAQLLLTQYWNTYGNGIERFRTVGTELGFGKDKEVPIITDPKLYQLAPFRAYYTGRIDRIVDNGHAIGPVDRKTSRYFKGKEESKYKPHDGMLGYVVAINAILGNKFRAESRECKSVIIDMIALREPTARSKVKIRFKRCARDFSQWEMMEWRRRQVSSFIGLYETVVLQRPYQWNTISCHNQYFRDCPYKVLHEADIKCREQILSTFFQQRSEKWSPYRTPETDEEKAALVLED